MTGPSPRLLFITQQLDRAHPLLAATVPQVAALARRAEEVVVLADGVDAAALPANARARRFAAATKPARGLRFEAALGAELSRRPRPTAVIAHMCPIYAVLAAPVALAFRVPVLLWYTHWYGGPVLRLAERLSTAVLSVDRSSFPGPSRKLHPIGHGIDLGEFPCREGLRRDGVRALSVGRYSPAKGLEALVRGVRLAIDRDVDAFLEVRGPAISRLEHEQRARLEAIVVELGLRQRVELGGVVPRSSLPALFAEHDLLVNNMRPGAPDKVVYEAAASCLPVVASNPAFADLIDDRFRFPFDDADAFADRLAVFAALDGVARADVGCELRRRVAAGHSVERWAERVLAVAAALSR